MAPKKKYRPRTSGLDKVLIGFLCTFGVLSVLLGLLVYLGFSGKSAAVAEASKEKRKKAALEQANDFYAFLAREARMAMGGELVKGVPLDEENSWITKRDGLLSGSSFSTEDATLRDKVKKWVEKNNAMLGFDPKKKQFNQTYAGHITAAYKNRDHYKGLYQKELVAKKAAEEKYNELSNKFEGWKTTFATELKTKHDAEIAQLKANSKEFIAQKKHIESLRASMEQQRIAYEQKLREKDALIAGLDGELKRATKAVQNGKDDPNIAVGQPHPLLLDISTGKPFWDQPRGKITRVIAKENKVYLDIGKANGVFPELTFTIFAPGSDGKAYGMLKGTVEVQQVIGPNTSMAFITSLFNTDGTEIPLNDIRRGGSHRLASNPIAQGDLLYNMFWNTHVALAGKFNITGAQTFSAAQEKRQLDQVKRLLTQHGITIDAYIDPMTGKIKGEITPKTRFLILGSQAFTDKNSALGDKMAAPGTFNAKMRELVTQAVNQGTFIISQYNFAAVAGYRPPRSSSLTRVGSFRARLPYAGRPGKQMELPGGQPKGTGY